jgi:hypothetical protein
MLRRILAALAGAKTISGHDDLHLATALMSRKLWDGSTEITGSVNGYARRWIVR